MGITLLNDLCYGHLKDSMHVYVYILVNVYSRHLSASTLVLHLLEEYWLDNSFPASSTSDSGSELYVWLRSAVQGPVILKVTEVIEYDICTYTRPYHCWQYQLLQLHD